MLRLMSTPLVILGRLPWTDPAPLRFGRWSDLVRSRPQIDRDEPDPRATHSALLAAHHALTGRVERVVLADPARLGPTELAALARLGAPCELVLVTDATDVPGALEAALAAVDPHQAALVLGAASIAVPKESGNRWYSVEPPGTFTPPGHPRRFPVDGALLAVPLVLGTTASLGPWAALSGSDTAGRPPDPQRLRLRANVRGAVQLVTRPRPVKPAGAVETTPPAAAPRDRATAMAIATLEPALKGVTDRLAFSGRDLATTRTAWLRDAGRILDDARARGLITAWTAELTIEGGQVVADVRIRTARRVEAVVLRLGAMEPSH
jgi:hypothetical protein